MYMTSIWIGNNQMSHSQDAFHFCSRVVQLGDQEEWSNAQVDFLKQLPAEVHNPTVQIYLLICNCTHPMHFESMISPSTQSCGKRKFHLS